MRFSADEIRAKLAEAPLRTTRLRVSVPIVNRFVAMLLSGRVPPPIEVAGDVIVDGTYRYVAALLCDRRPAIRKAAAPPAGLVPLRFAQVILDAVDHATAAKSDAWSEIAQSVAVRPPPASPKRRTTARKRTGPSKRQSRSPE